MDAVRQYAERHGFPWVISDEDFDRFYGHVCLATNRWYNGEKPPDKLTSGAVSV